VATHGANLGSITGPHAAEVKNAFAALQQYHAADVVAGSVGIEEIQVACLLGNVKLNAYLLAVSVGSVFFGANTYIGNGPNFMVKAIADHSKVHTPSFLKYVTHYTLPFMLTMLVIVWLIFFRG